MNEFQLDSPCAFVIVNEALKLNKKQEKKQRENTQKLYASFTNLLRCNRTYRGF